ncbi:restriction endonuclease subunit S [Phormidium tenue]|uniref:Restriction endonuclease subunit S n=1 Tax=Phormidium tenue FACHB-1050 TaxID=2692857 RepID=A0ABR8C9T4_9CYAN|nr:restriction endonuclease subunit S [Phormidium tenue]MBD2317532.1 restriction endonuclease subunit S [Phormidium tenue FACHB-1050]
MIQENKIPWLKDVNTTWQCFQVKRGFETVLGKMLQPTQRNFDDIEVPYLKALHIHWDGIKFEDLPEMWANQSEIKQLSLKQGDLIVCEGGEVGRGTLLNRQLPSKCIIQNSLHRVRNKELGETRFLRYILQSASDIGWLDVLCNRATIRHFTVEKFSEFWIAAPSKKEQKLIADYLDRETTQIDNLIAAKEQMLTLLEEKREALISQAVTRGLDPNVSFKRSGLDWLGDIPQHWQVCQLKRIWGSNDYGISENIRGDGEIKVLRMTCIEDGIVDLSKGGEVESVDPYLLLRKGDLLFNRTNSLDQVAKVGIVQSDPEQPTTFASYLVRIRSNDLAYPEFLAAYLNSQDFLTFTRKNAIAAIGQANLSPSRYGEIKVAIPPKSEQKEIVDTINKEREKTKELENALTNSIALLKERRSAIITAAVTGQISIQEKSKHSQNEVSR